MPAEKPRTLPYRVGIWVVWVALTPTPLVAQEWFVAERHGPPVQPHVLLCTTFDAPEFNFAMPTWDRSAGYRPTCLCGGGIDCVCGMCHACCLCNRGWRGWFHRSAGTWDGSLEVGMNGSRGNASNSNLAISWDGRRDFRQGELSFDFNYFLQKTESIVTMDRAVALGRYEREIGQSGIDWYVQGFFEYDDLRAYPGRLAVNAGVSRRWIETDRFQLTGRAGAGASKKIDAPGDAWRPELQLGADYEFRLTQRQKVFGHIDYFPDMTRFSTYRLNYKIAWEGLLEDDWGLAIRASLMNWYDSDPGPGTRSNDLYYMLSLVWTY